MISPRHRFRTLSALLFAAAAIESLAASADPLRLTHTVALPGVSGRIDHFDCAPPEHLLALAALGNGTVEFVDLATFQHRASLPRLRTPTGVIFLPGTKQLFVANGGEGSLRAYETAGLAQTNRVSALSDADNVRLDAAARLIYVGFGSGALGVVDPVAGRLLHQISLPAHPEAFQLEGHGSRIFVNLPDERTIAVVDRAKKSLVGQWRLEKWRSNFPMALDEKHHRLFVGCRHPARLVAFDTERGVAVGEAEIDGDTDDVFYDAKRRRLYVSCGAGFVDVLRCTDGDRFESLGRIPTRDGARTSYFSPELDLLFVAAPKRAGHDAAVLVFLPQ